MDKIGKKKQKLEEIVLKWKSEKNKIKKAYFYSKAIFIGGALPCRYQEDFEDKLNMSSKDLTIRNSILGLGICFGEYLIFGEAGGRISSEIAEWFDITYKSAVYLYIGYNTGQNIFRLSYAQIKKKGIAAFVPSAAVIDAVYIPYYYFIKKKKK